MTEAFQSHIHFDEDKNSEEHAEALLDDIDRQEDVSLAVLFCSTKFDLENFVPELNDSLGDDTELIGCTGLGEISNNGSTKEGAVLLTVTCEESDFHVGMSAEMRGDPEEAGNIAARRAVKDTDFVKSDRNRLVYTLMAGVPNAKEFEALRGIVEETGTEMPVVGGSAGETVPEMDRTYQFYCGEVHENSVVVCAIESENELLARQGHGLHNKIATGVVNEVDGTTIEKISGKPAAEFYADAIDKDLDFLKDTWESPAGEMQNTFKVGLKKALAEDLGQDNLRPLHPEAVTEDHGLQVNTEINENSSIHVVEGDKDDLINAAGDAFKDVKNPIFGLMVDCACRSLALEEEELDEEVQAIVDTVQCPIAGFYSYGEIGGEGSFCTVKKQTVSGFVMAEQ